MWLKNEDIPGLAMTRSFGDEVASRVGVTAEPGKSRVFEILPLLNLNLNRALVYSSKLCRDLGARLEQR